MDQQWAGEMPPDRWFAHLEATLRQTGNVPAEGRAFGYNEWYKRVTRNYGRSDDVATRFVAAAKAVYAGADWAAAVGEQFPEAVAGEEPAAGDDLAAVQAAARDALGDAGRTFLDLPAAPPPPPGSPSPPAEGEPPRDWTGFPASFYRTAFAPGETPQSARQPVPDRWAPGVPAPLPPGSPPRSSPDAARTSTSGRSPVGPTSMSGPAAPPRSPGSPPPPPGPGRAAPPEPPILLGQPTLKQYSPGFVGPPEVVPQAHKLITGTPVLPDGAVDPTKGKAVGGNAAELVRVVQQIRDMMRDQMARAARGDGAGPPAAEKRGPGLGDALRPVTDRVMQTRLGRVAGRFWERVQPHAQPLVDQAKKRAGKWVSRTLRGQTGGRGGAKRPPQPSGGSGRPGMGGAPKPTGGAPPAVGGAAAAEGGAGAEAGAAAAGAEGALAGAGGAAAAVALPVAVVAAFTVAAFEAGKALQEFGYEAERSNQKFRGVSPSQTAIWSRLDADRTFRTLQSGENRANTSQALANSLDRLERKLQPIEDALGKVVDLYAAVGVETLAQLVDVLNTLIRLVQEVFPKLKNLTDNKPVNGTSWNEMLEMTRRAEAAERRARDALDAARRAHAGR